MKGLFAIMSENIIIFLILVIALGSVLGIYYLLEYSRRQKIKKRISKYTVKK